MTTTGPPSMDRFKGSLLGVVMGDCLGAPFEGDPVVSKSVLTNYINDLNRGHSRKNLPYKPYTDDTAMSFALCRSLLEKNALDLPNLAMHFADEFIKDHRRGYGAAAKMLLLHTSDGELWKSGKDDDVTSLAKAAFEGRGSYGNGAAMRVAPVALFHAADPITQTTDSAYRQALITHSNGLGILGAVLQAAAVSSALKAEGPIEPKTFVEELADVVSNVEGIDDQYKQIFVKKLSLIPKYLAKTSIDHEVFLEDLGNDVTAHGAVPTAIYAFLKALQPSAEFETPSGVLRTIFTAIRLGGDTDTIASMAAAIAGAYHGHKDIPLQITVHCEGTPEAEGFAAKLHARIESQK